MNETPPFRRAVLHRGHPNLADGCGLVGFYAVRRPTEGTKVAPSDFAMPDGTSCADVEYIRCGACGNDMLFDYLRYVNDEAPRLLKEDRKARTP